jgi:hypothetical protein
VPLLEKKKATAPQLKTNSPAQLLYHDELYKNAAATLSKKFNHHYYHCIEIKLVL